MTTKSNGPHQRKTRAKSTPNKAPATTGPNARPLWLALVFVCGLAAFGFLPRIQGTLGLVAGFEGSSAILLVWLAILWIKARQQGRTLRIEVLLRPQHYLQAIVQTAIFVYWSFYWSPIKDAAVLIIAQVVFAYAFDSLLSWSRRDVYTLGFGPFPIIFSMNLFLRFHDNWFYLQFLMVAVGLLAKELIRWNKDGRRTHIFNPASFPLALFSIVLIATGMTKITWGEEIATLLILPPHIYLFLFLISLPSQFKFRLTTMTLPAVLTTYGFSMLYLKLTGTYFFFDSNVPVAVFLGMQLLITDPSTAPRTELGRVIFGILYGLTTIGLYAVLGRIGAPGFYDKLLQVPLMNLMIKGIDRFAESKPLAFLNPARIGARLAPHLRSLAYVSLWIVVFATMSVANGVGDRHPGHTIPFWEKACNDGRTHGCANLAVVESRYCHDGSAWSCNELGILVASVKAVSEPADRLFRQACGTGLPVACRNQRVFATDGHNFEHDDPVAEDYLVVLRGGKGPLPDRTPFEVYTRACDLGWMAGCNSLARFYFVGDGVPQDKLRAMGLLERACANGHGLGCSNLGKIYGHGDGVPIDETKSADYRAKACKLGVADACE